MVTNSSVAAFPLPSPLRRQRQAGTSQTPILRTTALVIYHLGHSTKMWKISVLEEDELPFYAGIQPSVSGAPYYSDMKLYKAKENSNKFSIIKLHFSDLCKDNSNEIRHLKHIKPTYYPTVGL